MANSYKFQRLRDKIIELINTEPWEVGSMFYSEAQLCLKFDVSRQTVRKAMQSLVDDGYLVKIQGSGTYLTEKAIEKRNAKTHVVGILVTYLSDYIFPIIIKELEKVFTDAGFAVQLASSGNSSKAEGELLRKMLNNKVDGIILEPTRSALPNPNVKLYKDLVAKKFPMVSIHSSYDGLNIPTVRLNDYKAGYLATEHLINFGHKNIGAILKSDDLQGHERYKGILAAHEKYNIKFDDQKVYWYTTEDISYFETLQEAVTARLDDCSAVVCYNDQIALSYQEMLLNKGYELPQDKSIASIDNSRLARLGRPPLTSVNSPIKTIGKIAAEQLLLQIKGEPHEESIILEPKLIIRNSSIRYDS